MSPGAAPAGGNNVFWNPNFEEGTPLPWVASFNPPGQGKVQLVNEELCFDITQPGVNVHDVILRQRDVGVWRAHQYTVHFKARATKATQIRPRVSQAGPPYKEYWSAVVDLGTEPQTFVGKFTGAADDEKAEFVIHLGGPLAKSGPVTVCLDDLHIDDPEYKLPEGRQAGAVPKIRVNQVGYLPRYHKIAAVKDKSPAPLDWQLVDASGKVVASGKSKVFGEDRAAGEPVHTVDFSSFTTPGTGYKLKVGADESAPFDIGKDVYKKLKYDALAYFYHNRSGIEIKAEYAGGPQWARPAGHLSDKSVPCAPEAKCNYSLDVSGGWYDAGDHGKYVVNGGISVWTVMNQYERFKFLGKTVADFGDGKLKIPENKNGTPDILDEARWQMEFMLRMQVPEGKPMAGMVHHKIHSEKWTPIPTRPDQDTVKRYLRPVGTAATLNLAASAAQAARIWKTLDPAFSQKCLAAAERAWAAAKKHPSVPAEGTVLGGGAYGDSTFGDETYWAAVELWLATNKDDYKKEFLASSYHKRIPTNAGGGTSSMSWDHLSALGKLSLLTVPNGLDKAEIAAQKKQVVDAADLYLKLIEKRGYRVPLESDTKYPWGSNSFVLNNMVVLAFAYDFTKDERYINGVVDSMDYILGRNPKAQSYVTGYGERPLLNPHHRFWARQADASYPAAPPGAVSGGPNSDLQDPYAKANAKGCPPQKCFVDHIQAWSTNEITINWNAPLAWAVAFLDEVGAR
jgi:endoglucanase